MLRIQLADKILPGKFGLAKNRIRCGYIKLRQRCTSLSIKNIIR